MCFLALQVAIDPARADVSLFDNAVQASKDQAYRWGTCKGGWSILKVQRRSPALGTGKQTMNQLWEMTKFHKDVCP